MLPFTTFPDVRLGLLTAVGSIRGTLPFTSFLSTEPNAFQSAQTVRRFPLKGQNYSIAFELQGFGATVACQDLPTSPILESGVICNPSTPASINAPALHMRAAYCNSTTLPASYDFHMRFYGDYIHYDQNGNSHNENITCSITPTTTLEQAVFRSLDNATWFPSNSTISNNANVAPALFEHILQTLVTMMVTFGQNSIDNLFAETVVQLTTSYAEGNYTAWPSVAQRQLEGMISYVGLCRVGEQGATI